MIGAVILAFLNTFVKRAAAQYLQDKELQDESVMYTTKGDGRIDVAKAKAKIQPPPQLFTDRFRWFLVGSSSPLESYLQVFSASSLERTGGVTESGAAVDALYDDVDAMNDETAADLSPTSSRDDAEEAMEINSRWLKWARETARTYEITSSYVTTVVGEFGGFMWVDTYPDIASWGKIVDADSDFDDEFNEVATCSSNRLLRREETMPAK